jgi:uncharacterized protein YjbI with pentapeptide repeats
VYLTGARTSQGYASLRGVHLTDVHHIGIYLTGMHLTGVYLTGVHLVSHKRAEISKF